MTGTRLRWLLAALVTIALGLASRKFPQALPAVLGKYPGDALWAVMIYCLLGAMRPATGMRWRASGALAICFAVEFTQLWQPPWLQAIRATTIGHLVLGSHFHTIDLFAYTVGVTLAAFLEVLVSACLRKYA